MEEKNKKQIEYNKKYRLKHPEKIKQWNKKQNEKTQHIRISKENYIILKEKSIEYNKTFDAILKQLFELI